jgi:hypothetical protein
MLLKARRLRIWPVPFMSNCQGAFPLWVYNGFIVYFAMISFLSRDTYRDAISKALEMN